MAVPPAPDAWKFEFQQGRSPVGESIPHSADNVSANPGSGKLRPRGNASPDGNLTAGVAHRSGDLKVGGTYRVQAVMPKQMQENAAVTANGRILKPTFGRSDSFYAQDALGIEK